MASVFLGDLDDFIAPGQACINPLFTTADDAKASAARAPETSSGSNGGAAMVLELEDDGVPLDAMAVEEAVKPDLIKASNTQTAKVSLDDCLACSGCVTSAETVLITQQSTGKLREAVESGRHSVIVASITPQARASLAERLGLSAAETHARLLTFLREQQGVHHLVDSSIGADFSLLEAGEEFVRRWRHNHHRSGDVAGPRDRGGDGGGVVPARATAWAAPPRTVALSSTRRFNVNGQVVLRFAYAYGFRNIQSILAKARRGKCPYHFVEVMACPSGCVNGGGQIKPKKKEGPRDTRQRVEKVSQVLRDGRVPRGPHDNPLVKAVYTDLVGGAPGKSRARELLHTSYHNVPKLELSNPHMSPW
eukprot:g10371.t1